MEKQKIGILTFFYAVNPGSALQAYGLWKTIKSFDRDIDCHIINYHTAGYRKYIMDFPSKLSIKDFVTQLYMRYSFFKYQRFWKGIDADIQPSHWLNENGIRSIGRYDCIVAGSDQIWNTRLTGKNYIFFLNFISGVKKVSYGASIGLHDFPSEDKDIIAGFLKDFNFISVREPEAQDAIENLLGRRPQLVLDPSFLLQKKQYEEIAVFPNFKEKYIFLYLRHKDSKIVTYARKMSKALNMHIVECHGGARKIYKDDKIVRQPDPRRWLGWMMNAEYVFTDSFHGCAFCINLNKQFFAKISSANSEMSSRIYHVLNRYGMRDRLIEEDVDVLSMDKIDFSKSNRLLMQDREESKAFLRNALDLK